MPTLAHVLTLSALLSGPAAAAPDGLHLGFDDGVDGWQVVVDGVMGGRSSGRVSLAEPGVMLFAGDLSLENNGGFSQARTSVPGDAFAGAEGVEIRVRGDGRKYNFDIRCSNVRMMAGGFQQQFDTEDGAWTTVRLPFDGFRLYSFGRRVAGAPALEPTRIESLGVTLADKVAGPFRLEIDSIRAYGGESEEAPPPGGDLATVARGAGLNTLLELVAAAGLELPDGQRVTILAPTDAAFAALPAETLRKLRTPEGLQTLRTILAYHAAVPAYTSADLLSRRSVQTLNGQRVAIEAAGPVRIGGAGIVAVDVPFDGGVVHVIDRVLMPDLESIAQKAAATESLSTLASAVAAAGLGDQLGAENGPFTVFAPVNSAFERLSSAELQALLQPENRRRLVEILGLHVVPGRLYASDLLAARQAQTFFGESIEFALDGGRLRVGDAALLAADIEAANGVVHLIDTVLLPDASAPDAISAEACAEGVRLCELAIGRGVPLFNAGQAGACAAVYEVAIEALLGLGGEALGRDVVRRLEMSLAEAETQHTSTERAWTYRRAIDDAHALMAGRTEQRAAEAAR